VVGRLGRTPGANAEVPNGGDGVGAGAVTALGAGANGEANFAAPLCIIADGDFCSSA